MLKVYKSNCFASNQNQFFNTFFGGRKQVGKTIHITPIVRYPQVAELKLPTNVININEAEMGRFSPLRARDISGPVINAYNIKHTAPQIDITLQSDPHVNKYDCRGAVSLSSSMQSNVPSPFTGNKTHLNMPGSQWGQGHKYLSDHLHSAHYLTLRNEYRGKLYKEGFADCLDYIFYEKSKLLVKQVIPFPSDEELKAHTALPSIVFPSDHIAIISDLEFQ